MPAMPRLFLDYVRKDPGVAPFYPRNPSIDTIERYARECVSLDSGRRAALVKALGSRSEAWGGAPSALDKLAGGAVAVVTGQQAGLFTGPLLTVFKALTVLKLARELEQRGVPAVPVFWIAAEDHDSEEISWAGIVTGDSRFERIRTVFGETAAPAAWLKYPESFPEVVGEWFDLCPSTEFRDPVREMVENAYRPSGSPVDGFGRMMTALFRGTDLVLADPMDPGLRALAVEALGTVRDRNGEIRTSVLDRTEAIRRAGYSEQVRVDPSFTGLFVLDGLARVKWDPRTSRTAAPSDLSPNVLVRPFVQDSLFPTAAYVAGSSEIAYFAQAGAVYECLDRPMPPLWPRITATLIEPPVARILAKYRWTLEDVFAGPALLRRSAVDLGSQGELFDEVALGVRTEAERLRQILERADKTLGGALDTTIEKMMRPLEGLRSRFVAAESRRDELLDRQLQSLGDRLFPEQKLQERAVNVTSFLVRYGTHLITLIDERLDLDGTVHQVVEI
jgi:uncharacterized protein YllA (UPF0747 family)